MKLFIWEGPLVLRRYSSGVAVAVAPDLKSAWLKIKQKDKQAFYLLSMGYLLHTLEETDAAYEQAYLEEVRDGDPPIKDGFPIEPKAYDLEASPGIVCWGSE